MVTSYVKNMEHSLDIIGLHFLHFRTLVSEFYVSIPLEKSFFDDRNSQINDPLRSDQLNKYWSEVMNLCIPVIFHPQSSV